MHILSRLIVEEMEQLKMKNIYTDLRCKIKSQDSPPRRYRFAQCWDETPGQADGAVDILF